MDENQKEMVHTVVDSTSKAFLGPLCIHSTRQGWKRNRKEDGTHCGELYFEGAVGAALHTFSMTRLRSRLSTCCATMRNTTLDLKITAWTGPRINVPSSKPPWSSESSGTERHAGRLSGMGRIRRNGFANGGPFQCQYCCRIIACIEVKYHEIRWTVKYRWMLGHVSGGSNLKCERISPSVYNALLHAIKVNCVRATRNLCSLTRYWFCWGRVLARRIRMSENYLPTIDVMPRQLGRRKDFLNSNGDARFARRAVWFWILLELSLADIWGRECCESHGLLMQQVQVVPLLSSHSWISDT